MKKEKMKVPQNALYFREPMGEGALQFKEDGDRKSFSMVAYSGSVIKDHWYWGDLAMDVEGMTFMRRAFPILEEHFRDLKIGFSNTKPKAVNHALVIEDAVLLSNDTARSFYQNAKEGFPYEASISIRPTVIERLLEGESVEVNGYKFKGPGTVFRKGLVREASVCTFGYDSKTSVSVFNDTEEKELYIEVFSDYDKEEDATQSIVELKDATSEGDVKKNEEGGRQTMTLAELREKYPELFKDLDAETETLRNDLADRDRKITVLEEANAQLKEDNSVMGERVAKLEKSETIRTERELKAIANDIFTGMLSDSNIPERLYPKVKAQVNHGKFVQDGKFDEEAFAEACKKEIESWEADLSEAYKGRTTVQGMSQPRDGGNSKEEKNEKLVDRMLSHVVPNNAE